MKTDYLLKPALLLVFTALLSIYSASKAGTLVEKTSLCGYWDSRHIACTSEIYFSRKNSEEVYFCSVRVGGPDPIHQIPEQINCYPIGTLPFGNSIVTPIGRSISAAVDSKNPRYSTYSWQNAFWVSASDNDELAFCNWREVVGIDNINFRCVTRVLWDNYDPGHIPNQN